MFRFPVHWVLVLVENVWGPAETKETSEKQQQTNLTHKYNTNIYKVLLHRICLPAYLWLKIQRLNVLFKKIMLKGIFKRFIKRKTIITTLVFPFKNHVPFNLFTFRAIHACSAHSLPF